MTRGTLFSPRSAISPAIVWPIEPSASTSSCARSCTSQQACCSGRGCHLTATYLFKHALVQDAAYGTLLREPRRALHARIAETLEGHFAEIAESQPELLARHCTEAGLIEKAAGLWGKAGQRSLARSALVEAAAQLTRALAQLGGLPATPALRREQITLQVALITPLCHVKGYAAPESKAAVERARLLIEEAKALGEPPEDPLLLFSVLYGFWVANYVVFNGDVCRDLAAQFLSLAEKQQATVPLIMGHRLMGASLLHTGDLAEGRAHYARALALYDPAEQRPLVARFGGVDIRVAILANRSIGLWPLGYPEAALADAEQALQYAREVSQAPSLMFALLYTSITYSFCANYAVAKALADELVALGDETGATFWKAAGIAFQGSVLSLTGQAADAVHTITSGITAWRSMGGTVFSPWWLSCLARAYAELSRYDDAWRCIGEAMTLVETTKERWCEAEVYRMAGEIALLSSELDAAKAEALFRARARRRPPTTSQILGTPRRHEPRAPLARPGQGAASARTACSGLRLVHGGVRHARSEGGEGAAGGVGGIAARNQTTTVICCGDILKRSGDSAMRRG